MKFKKILSAVVALSMTATMAVMPLSAKAADLYNSYTTSAEDKMLTINLNDFMETGETYEFSFNVKPESVDVWNSIRVDLGFQGNVTGAGNYGIFYLYENATAALGTSDWAKIGNVEAYKDYVAENGVDMKMLWDTENGTVDITADFGEKEYNYTYTPGVVADGGSYGKFIVWSESTTVKVTNLEIKKLGEEVPAPNSIVYEKKGDWKISGEHNYLKTGDLGLKADGKYIIEFGVKAPTGNPGFYFDWRDYANNTKSGCASWNYKALVGIYDDGSNDCLALGVAPNWAGTIKRDGMTNEYKYTVKWDVAKGKFDMTVSYKKTSDGTTGSYTGSYTSSGAFSTSDVLKFATNGGTATVTDLTIKNWDPEYYYMESYKTTGEGNAYYVSLDNYFVTGNKYEISWNITPDSIDNQSIRADILWGNTAAQGNHGFFLLYNGGTDALGMSDYGKIGNVADYTADVLTKGVDFKMIWDTATGKADITVTFPTGKSYTYTYNAGVIASGQKYGSLYLQGPNTAITVKDLEIKKYVKPEGKPNPVIDGTAIQEVDMEDYQGKAWDVSISSFDSEKTYTAEFVDGEETKSGEINFDNVETSGSVAFAIFLHTERTATVLDVIGQ